MQRNENINWNLNTGSILVSEIVPVCSPPDVKCRIISSAGKHNLFIRSKQLLFFLSHYVLDLLPETCLYGKAWLSYDRAYFISSQYLTHCRLWMYWKWIYWKFIPNLQKIHCRKGTTHTNLLCLMLKLNFNS